MRSTEQLRPSSGASQRRFVTIGELERIYGADATVEVNGDSPDGARSAEPTPAVRRLEPPSYDPVAEPAPESVRGYAIYDDGLDEDEVVVPKRSRGKWIAVTSTVMIAAAGLLGYGLYRHGDLGSLNVGASPSLGPTEDSEIVRDFQLPPIVARMLPTPMLNAPPTTEAAPAPTSTDEPVAAPARSTPKPAAAPAPSAPKRAAATRPSAAKRVRVTPRSAAKLGAYRTPYERWLDDQATRETISQDLKELQHPSSSTTTNSQLKPSATPARPNEKRDVVDYPPGYIESYVPTKP